MRITATDAALLASGHLVGPTPESVGDGISFDSRQIRRGQAFVAISGARDGHDFLDDAVRNGASFLIVGRGRSLPGVTCVEVDDTIVALADLARGLRQRLSDRNQTAVVGITGSVGKTTTKNMVREVLVSGFASAHGAWGSFNNDIGLPVTIINAPDDCEAMVLELAMRGHGEISRLCTVAQPTVAVVTLIGDAHSDRVGGIEGVARAKGEIFEGLAVGGTAVVNRDDPWMPTLVRRCPQSASVVTFGAHHDADVRYEIIGRDDQGRAVAQFIHGGSRESCVVPLPGDHMVSNAAAAVAVGVSLGVGLNRCVTALATVEGEPGRMRWFDGRGGLRVLDDSYNANSSSMLAALDAVAATGGPRRVAVLGAIAEVADSEAVHRAVIERAEVLGVEVLILETDKYGIEPLSLADVVARLTEMDPGTVVLVKGSRAARTDRVVSELVR